LVTLYFEPLPPQREVYASFAEMEAACVMLGTEIDFPP